MGAIASRRKILLRVILALGGLFLLALILVPILVPAEKWQQIAFERLEKQTGLVASAESAGVSLFPLGLKLQGLQVRDPQNRPEWSGLELDLHEAVVRASLRPLFSGRFEAAQVTLKQPRLILRPVQVEAVDEEIAGAPGTDPADKGAATSLSIALAAVSVEDAYIEVHQPDGTSFEIHGMSNLSSMNIDGGRGEATAEGDLDSLRILAPEKPAETLRALGWKLDARFVADASSGSVELHRLQAPGVTLSGAVNWGRDRYTTVDARLDLDADVAGLAREWLDPRRDTITWPEGTGSGDFVDLSGTIAGVLAFDGSLDPALTPEQQVEQLRFEGSARNLTGRILGREGLATLQTDIRFSSGDLEFTALQVKTDAGTLQGSWAGRPLEQADSRLDLAGSVDVAVARQIAADLWPRLSALAGEGVTGPGEWPAARGKMEVQLGADLPAAPETEARIQWSAQAASLVVRPVDVDADFTLADLRLKGDAKNLAWEGGTVTGPGVELSPRVKVGLSDSGTRVSGEMVAKRLDLDELQASLAPPVETALLPWFVSVAHAAEQMWTPPAGLSADLVLRAEEVSSSGHRLTAVKGRASLEDQQLGVEEISATLGTGKVTGVAAVDYAQTPPAWNTRLRADAVPAATLLAPDAPKLASALETTFSGDLEFDGPLSTDPDAAMRALSGKLSLASAAGTLLTEPVLGDQISKFVGQFAPKWQRLVFSALDAELTVDQGDVLFDRFLLSGETTVKADGKVSLDGRCDYRLDIVLPAGATPQVGALQPVVDLLRAGDGTFPFSVLVTGPAAKPKVEIDFDTLRKRAEERGKDELGDKVEGAVKDLLGKLKGKN